LLGQQQVPRGVACICAMTVDNVRGEQDLETKPLKDLIAILQKDDPFVQHKREAIQKRTTCKKDKELDQGKWHFRKDGLLYYLQRLYVPDKEVVQSRLTGPDCLISGPVPIFETGPEYGPMVWSSFDRKTVRFWDSGPDYSANGPVLKFRTRPSHGPPRALPAWCPPCPRPPSPAHPYPRRCPPSLAYPSLL
jgi:hypothetical protein